jgi:hypothetical protein
MNEPMHACAALSVFAYNTRETAEHDVLHASVCAARGARDLAGVDPTRHDSFAGPHVGGAGHARGLARPAANRKLRRWRSFARTAGTTFGIR